MGHINDIGSAIGHLAREAEPGLIEIRRDLHAHPELAFEEHRTASLIARELGRLGIEHRSGVGRTGVVGTIQGGRPGPTLAIRADMDALPIHEQTALPYASRTDGKMHACGHDVHSSTLLGVAGILARLAPEMAGTVRLVFQPAEEILGGAAAMIEDGVLDGVDMALGFHNHPDMPVGRFAAVRGATYAACDRFRITVRGTSGHAAYPHTTIDPIVAACHLVAGLQTVVAREVNPLDPCVVTVGAIHAGTVHNIIPDSCELLGTVRSLSAPVRAQAEAAIHRICAGLDATFRTATDCAWTAGVPPTMNADRAQGVAAGGGEPALRRARLSGGDERLALDPRTGRNRYGVAVFDAAEPSMGAEDFAMFAARVPSFVLRVGSGQAGRADNLHNSAYQPDEACIGLGAQALARAAVELLAG